MSRLRKIHDYLDNGRFSSSVLSVPRDTILDARKYGIPIEMEHTTDKRKAYKIALQHSCEFGPKVLYYQDGLIPMEKKLNKMKRNKK